MKLTNENILKISEICSNSHSSIIPLSELLAKLELNPANDHAFMMKVAQITGGKIIYLVFEQPEDGEYVDTLDPAIENFDSEFYNDGTLIEPEDLLFELAIKRRK